MQTTLKNVKVVSKFRFGFMRHVSSQWETAWDSPLNWRLSFLVFRFNRDIGCRSSLPRGLLKGRGLSFPFSIREILTMLMSSENPTPVHILVFVVEITNVIRSCEEDDVPWYRFRQSGSARSPHEREHRKRIRDKLPFYPCTSIVRRTRKCHFPVGNFSDNATGRRSCRPPTLRRRRTPAS